MSSTDGLVRGMKAVDTGRPHHRAGGRAVPGPALQPARPDHRRQGRRSRPGRPTRSTGPRPRSRSRRPRPSSSRPASRSWTCSRPYHARRQDRPVRRRGRGQDRAHPGADPQHRHRARRLLGVRRRRRAHPRGQRPLPRDDRVGGHRQDGDGVRPDERAARRAPARGADRRHHGRVLPRREGQDVLLFIDNIFRFVQAGSEVSALLGRMPSAVGYQPTLATEMGALQERITSTKRGSITSVQAIYVPADDITDPAPATTFAHLDATTVLDRAIAERGIYPAVDPLASTSRILDPQDRGRGALRGGARGAADPAALQGPAGHHRHPRHGRAVGRGQAAWSRARGASSSSCRSRSSWPRRSPGRPAST